MTNKEVSRKKLEEITKVILDLNSPPGILLNACHDMYALFGSITGVGEASEESIDQNDIFLESGKALAPIDAARCVNDMARTSNYLRGLKEGISEAIKRFPHEPVKVLYAGCGPYATLAVPLMTCFSQDDVKFTLMDINERSLNTARALIKTFGFHNFIDDFLLCDAVTYQHPEDKPIHVIVTETMQRAFDKEPQVALTLNLASQLEKEGIFIPQGVEIKVCLANFGCEHKLYPAGTEIPEEDLKDPARNRKRLPLGPVLNFTAESAMALAKKIEKNIEGIPAFPPIKIEIPEIIDDDFDTIMLLTHIEVFNKHGLKDYDSGLTQPFVLHDLGKPKRGSTLEFRYVLGERPGYEWRVI